MNMIQVATSSVTGAALDWLLANIEGLPIRFDPMAFCNTANGGYWVWEEATRGRKQQIGPGVVQNDNPIAGRYSPSTLWSQLGPLLFRYPIAQPRHESSAELMLALSRAIVAQHYGDTVRIPRLLH